MNDIYNDGSYIETNPSLHSEDSSFKYTQIKKFLNKIQVVNNKISILDIGGGAGIIGKNVAEYFATKKISVEFTALDLSKDMLEVQRENNPLITNMLNKSVAELEGGNYDLILLIDVIEHIPDYENVARKINELARYVMYNIPIELNLFDILRNIKTRGNYYKTQERLIGHINRFSYFSSLRYINKYHVKISNEFVGYYEHILASNHIGYKQLLASKQRKLEVLASRIIGNFLPIFAPLIIQGSNYILVETK